jgi:hypothetical protein
VWVYLSKEDSGELTQVGSRDGKVIFKKYMGSPGEFLLGKYLAFALTDINRIDYLGG